MKAALLKDFGDVRITELTTPEPADDEALIRVIYAGVCGSDVTVYDGKHPTATVPVVVGHEIIGIIEKIADGSEFKVGDRVTVEPLISCHRCKPCKKGHTHVCKSLKLLGIHENGGYAQYVKASVKKLVKVSDELPHKLAALAEPFAVGCHVVRRSGLGKDDRALVIGAGPIGIVVALSAMETGAEVYISEVNAERLALAEELGIKGINPMKCDFEKTVDEITEGGGFDVVYEASGSKQGILQSTRVCSVRGVIVPMSLSGAPVEFELGKVSFKEMSVIGSRVYSFEDFVGGVRNLEAIAKKTDLNSIVSDIIPLENADLALEMMKSGKNRGKILIDCR